MQRPSAGSVPEAHALEGGPPKGPLSGRRSELPTGELLRLTQELGAAFAGFGEIPRKVVMPNAPRAEDPRRTRRCRGQTGGRWTAGRRG